MPVSTGWGPPICPRVASCPGIGTSAHRDKLSLAERWAGLWGSIDIPPGGDLFSHSVARAVSSALGRLTSVFGMGTGGAAPLEPPGSISIGQVCTIFHKQATPQVGIMGHRHSKPRDLRPSPPFISDKNRSWGECTPGRFWTLPGMRRK